MSEHIFGVTTKWHNARTAKRLDAICRAEGGHGFISCHPVGSNTRGWFTCRNYGEPFNSATARRVLAAIRVAGIDY